MNEQVEKPAQGVPGKLVIMGNDREANIAELGVTTTARFPFDAIKSHLSNKPTRRPNRNRPL